MVVTVIADVVEQARKHLFDLTGLKPVEVTGVFHDDQGWHVRVELLEMVRIPASADVLAEYEVLLDEGGTLLSFQRKRSRLRAQPIEEEAV